MSRTEELRDSGARRLAGGGSDAPFLKWPDKGGLSYAYVEGCVSSIWSGKYGPNITITAEHGQGIRAVSGSEADQRQHKIEPGMELNVSLGYSALRDAAELIETGHSYHIAFIGWARSAGGQQYRMFEIYDLGGDMTTQDTEDFSNLGNDPDDLPF